MADDFDRDALERAAIRQLRGTILKLLSAAALAGGIKAPMLHKALSEETPRRIDEALSYLETAGLAEKKLLPLDKRDRMPRELWKPTARGMQVAEGVGEDPAVDVG